MASQILEKHYESNKPETNTDLAPDEINEIYKLPLLSHREQEEYFALDDNMIDTVRKLDKLETKVYFILLIGYFRAKPVIPKFHLKEVREDVRYICKTYFPGKKPSFAILHKSTRAKLISKMLSMLGFGQLTKELQVNLIARLQDVATISTEPRYIFDECLAFFGQKRITLTGYTTLQDLITEALSAERQRTELILSQQMSDGTAKKLRNVLNKKGILNSLSGYKGSARGFSPSELGRELQTHQTIKDIYPELKNLIGKLELSQGNMVYYASIISHGSIYKIRRYPQWQGLLYLVCYLYYRYRDTNDKLVTAFCYLTRKHNEAAQASAKQRVADELEVIRSKLKDTGNILRFFVDDGMSDSMQFGEVRKQAFSLISKDEMKMISQHLDKNDFDLVGYQWQYTDKQSKKIANSLRKLFIAIDIECEAGQNLLAKQIASAKGELEKKRTITTVDQRLIQRTERPYICEGDETNTRRFEFYLYNRVFKMLNTGKVYVTESEKNKRLEDDLITDEDWKDKHTIIDNTGLARLASPIVQTLTDLGARLNSQIKRVTAGINSDTNEFVKRHIWTLPCCQDISLTFVSR